MLNKLVVVAIFSGWIASSATAVTASLDAGSSDLPPAIYGAPNGQVGENLGNSQPELLKKKKPKPKKPKPKPKPPTTRPS